MYGFLIPRIEPRKMKVHPEVEQGAEEGARPPRRHGHELPAGREEAVGGAAPGAPQGAA